MPALTPAAIRRTVDAQCREALKMSPDTLHFVIISVPMLSLYYSAMTQAELDYVKDTWLEFHVANLPTATVRCEEMFCVVLPCEQIFG